MTLPSQTKTKKKISIFIVCGDLYFFVRVAIVDWCGLNPLLLPSVFSLKRREQKLKGNHSYQTEN